MSNFTSTRGKGFLWLSLLVAIASFCLQFSQDFGNLLKRWDTDDFSYCYLVPFLFLYLVYTKKGELKQRSIVASPMGFPVIVLAGVFYLVGRLGSLETLTYLAIWTAIVGLAFILLGTSFVRSLAYPFIILAFIVPLPPFLNNLFTFKLKLISSALSVKMMQAAGLSVFREGNIIDLGVTQLQVVDACSGLRYVYPLLLMGFVFAYLFHKRWWDRAAVILASVPISVLSNAIRIAVTGYLTSHVSQEVAEGFFHGFSGWLIFMLSFIILAILSWLLKRIKTSLPEETAAGGGNSGGSAPVDLSKIKAGYLWGASILFLAFWGINISFASNVIVPERKSFKGFPAKIGDWEGEKTFLREEILRSLWADDYVQIHFKNQKTGDVVLLFVPYYEYQGTRHTAHAPASCLIGGGYAPQSSKILRREFPEPFGRVEIGQMLLEKDRQLLLSNYWFQQRGRVIVSEYANKWYLFQDALTMRRTDGALVRIEMPLRQGRDVEAAQSVVDGFTKDLMKILPEYIPN